MISILASRSLRGGPMLLLRRLGHPSVKEFVAHPWSLTSGSPKRCPHCPPAAAGDEDPSQWKIPQPLLAKAPYKSCPINAGVNVLMHSSNVVAIQSAVLRSGPGIMRFLRTWWLQHSANQKQKQIRSAGCARWWAYCLDRPPRSSGLFLALAPPATSSRIRVLSWGENHRAPDNKAREIKGLLFKVLCTLLIALLAP